MNQIRKRLTYANVMSSIAVFLVLGGGTAFALAKNSIGTRELKPNSVNRAILARKSVYPGKINLEAVKAGRIAKNAIARDRLRNGIVSTDKIQDNAVTGAKVNEPTLGQVPSAVSADSADTADSANTAGNANTLGGSPPSAFLSSNGVRADGSRIYSPIDDFTSGAFTNIVSKTFTAPSDGFIYLTGSVSTLDDATLAGPGFLLFRLTVDGAPLTMNPLAHGISTSLVADVAEGSGSTTAVVPVSAGPHAAALQAREVGSGNLIEGREISVLFVPNGSA